MKPNKRNINVDVVRCVAVFSVLSVHFFLNTGFYNELIIGKRMYGMVMLRTLFMICVPLFLLITGYLMCNKRLNKGYFKGISKTLLVYSIVSIMLVFFLKYCKGNDISIKRSLLTLFGEYIGYSWYVEMYIGLFLMIPFLNILYQGIESRKRKQFFIGVLLICSTLPSMVNIFEWFQKGFWIKPSDYQNYMQLIPDWWSGIWPLTYYFIGAYIREFDIKISVRKNLFMIMMAVWGFGTFNYYRSYGGVFSAGAYTDWGGFENLIDSVLIFLLILHINLEKLNGILRKVILKISDLSFGTYLVSCIVDNVLYPQFNAIIKEVPLKLEWYFVVVPISFIISLLLSQIVNWASNSIIYAIQMKIQKKNKVIKE